MRLITTLFTTLLALLLTLTAAAQPQPQPRRVRIGGGPDPSLTKDWPQAEPGSGLAGFEKTLDALASRDLFSGTVLVAKNGEPVLTKSFGFADKEKSIANTHDTKYNLGSINKIFTKVALLQLRREGKIDFSKTLRTYLPDYPSKIADQITIQQMLDHSSGMGDHFGPAYEAMPKEKLRTLRDYLPLFADQPLEFEPGTRKRYSNAAYIALGLVIEKVSGMSYHDYVQQKIFTPAGMGNAADAKGRATGYIGAQHDRPNTTTLPALHSSAGGGYATVTDLLRFTRALPKLLSADDYRALVGAVPGVGWGGGSAGINASIELEGDYTIVALSNYDPPTASYAASQARRALGLGGEDD